ncbi:MAG: SLBB domain-containing protein [Culturomica sp.]|jgi:protein involved in polysaccharide export with SLBB domain|nr:SLBB domain-containing protein [Culturomica sp.]
MIVKKLLLLLIACFFSLFFAFGQLSDEQIIQEVRNAQEKGMNQQQIALILMQKGVTAEQMQRLKTAYEEGTLDVKNSTAVKKEDRLRKSPAPGAPKPKDRRFLKEEESGRLLFESPGMSGYSVMDSIEKTLRSVEEKPAQQTVFGQNIFNNELLTFEPQLNIATPEDYRLGGGDEVIIDVWGASETSVREVISPDGTIAVDRIGPVYLNGLTIKEANSRIRQEFARIYAGIGSGNTFIRLTLGQIRSIQVNVMGEVVVPGTYTLPSLASVFHALYQAGGINPIGSLRSVKVFRNGKQVADADVYAYILQGKTDRNIVLQDGDVVVVAPYRDRTEITGKVKRPMVYEMKEGEKLSDLIAYAGGFTGDAYKKTVRVIRKSGLEFQVYNVENVELEGFPLADGDVVSVDSVLNRFENRVEVRGAVYREGIYALDKKVATVGQLVERADGIRGDAFVNRAVLYRERTDFTQEVMALELAGVLRGTAEDIPLQKNDVLYIPSIYDLQEEYTITVKGEVGNPGTYPYADNMTLEDLVIQSGGLLEAASTVKVDVARRIKDAKKMEMGELRAQIFTLSLTDRLTVAGQPEFTLMPFDEVYVRRSPGYQVQQDVFLEGEVVFPGEYALAKRGSRLSDLILQATGLTQEAYPEGARLLRKNTPEEKQRIRKVMEDIARQQSTEGKDTLQLDLSQVEEYHQIGIDLRQAIQYPGSDNDIILKEGDRLIVPEYTGTVKINGAVMHPNTVVYVNGKKAIHYVKQAGGFMQRARKNKLFVVYMNGMLAQGKHAEIRPGCEIIVPMKQPRRGGGLAEIMAVASSTTSMAAMVASILSLTK